ncbi:hypothetical protein SAMN02745126_03760 [Enhydrobacter aerosaccus]|uniref:Uncharacterized protein n=1 Tax=Enhydrobacter aerosaccus TaxID=225324 RepID=A0A1T4RBU1_9HYPH|nr:hypothetical protein [Enhydrobacter aerosaccus]SKA13423.1 hypothetical protein SAMN02745126_03760 [Enhydrobacter aerosaccus]
MDNSSGQMAAHLDRPRGTAGCGRAGCACSLPVGERFVLWAMRQWQQDRALPSEDSILYRGFRTAGLLEVLPDFAVAMDALLFGARRAIHIHLPTCSSVSGDEATLVALCGLAQSDLERPLLASLDVMMAPTASRVAAERLKVFALALGEAGLRLAPPAGAAGAGLH